MLDTEQQVVFCLLTYVDWWQPSTSSLLQVPAGRRNRRTSDGLRPGLLETMDVRSELSRRVLMLGDRDRKLLLLWYVEQLAVEDVARALRISRRQCFRRRAHAIRKIVELGEDAA